MFLEDKELKHVKDLMRGTAKPDGVLTELKQFFLNEFSCEIYAYLCDVLADGRHRLRFIVWDEDNRKAFYIATDKYLGPDDRMIDKIKTKFSELCRTYQVHQDYRSPENYFAVPTEIKSDLLKEIQDKVLNHIRRYLENIKDVKKTAFCFGTVHVFYETDADIENNAENGLSDKIGNDIYKIKKAVDEFGACQNGGVIFSSIQTLNEKYGGSTQYYFR